MTKPILIYLIAGEASADALGAGLMEAMRELQPGVQFAGIGGEMMQASGLKSLFPYSELSIMGFWEIVPHIPKMLRLLRQTALDIVNKQPDVVVTIDSPGFNFRLAQALKNSPLTENIKRVHYVAPSVWAYKPQRAKRTAELFNALLALLPFEPPYFEKEGLPTTFVGHPVLWSHHKGDGAAFRERHAIRAETPLLLLLPGSRKGEVNRHLPLFIEAAKSLPNYTPVILASPQVIELISDMAGDTLVIDIAEKYDAFAAATMALSKSGTITLELAFARVPMVVAHKVSAVSAWLARRWLLIPYVSLVNIAAKKEVVPELIQEKCTVPVITQALKHLAKPSVMELQRTLCAESLQMLKGESTMTPHTIAAKTILSILHK